MQNPSFETVIGSSGTSGVWSVLETATTQVPQWTRTSTSLSGPLVLDNATFGWPGFQGSRLGMLPGYAGDAPSQVQGLIGVLSSPTTPGAPYAASVAIALQNLGESIPGYFNPLHLVPPQPATFELRLRSSATGAESAPILQASIDQTISWMPMTGTVTANAAYDRVVLRFHQTLGASTRMGLVDDVRLCGTATAPATPNLPLGSSLAAAVKQTISPAAAPTCATDAANLVQNPSFESVTGGVLVFGQYAYGVAETATTEVPHWTRTEPSLNAPGVFNSGVSSIGYPQLSSHGSRFAGMRLDQGVAGMLSAATSVGLTYALKATIGGSTVHASTFDLRLRNIVTGAESAPVLQGSPSSQANEWVVFTGSVTADDSYQQVVLRFYPLGPPPGPGAVGIGVVDDIQLCLAAASTPVSPSDSLPVGVVAGVVLVATLLLGGLGFALRTSFVSGASGGVWRSGRVTALAVDPSDPSRHQSIGDPHETTGDGFKISENESPRPRDR